MVDFDFSNEDLMCVAIAEENSQENHPWRLNFERASNAVGNGIGAILVSPNRNHYPFTSKLDFDSANNMAEYKAYILGIGVAIEQKIKILEVYGDSALMADALATLASMIKVNKLEDMKPIQMSIYETPAHCYSIEEDENDNHPWYQDILQYMKNREYPDQAIENDRRTLRRLAIDYVLDGEILYKRGNDQDFYRATPFTLVYRMKAILPIEVEIPFLRVLAELKLDETEWIQSRYDQLNLIEGKKAKNYSSRSDVLKTNYASL
ncbi:uncharacterized protein [Gossypium hirsutum]|uniref:RNase H type-1 domain-containing protein n=1 Tax=Gossypium hirsutum TaxID=3635 RepID=A0ABM3BBV2_GOSHI|nr:uncharacterized protein LOC107919320 [Gossypium hirsutum]